MPTNTSQKVLFNNELQQKSDGTQYVKRFKNKILDLNYVLSTVKGGGGTIMVWSSYSASGVGPIHIIKVTIDHYIYVNILRVNKLCCHKLLQ